MLGVVSAALALGACGIAPQGSSRAKSGSTTTTAMSASLALPPSNTPGTAPVAVDFSEPLGPHWQAPTVSPATPGSWSLAAGSKVLVFNPSTPWLPGVTVSISVPAGEPSASGANTGQAVGGHFTVGPGSTLRLQQLLATLGYLPVSFQPAGPQPATPAAQLAAIYSPPQGSFTWRWPGSMPDLESHWQAGAFGPMTKGAIMAFQRVEQLPVTGQMTPGVWQALFKAVAAGAVNPSGYSWVEVSQGSPEMLTLWHNGSVVLRAPTNTGIASRATYVGSFTVYQRYRSQVMTGTNPNGSHYSDQVYWVSYFQGGDAIHGFVRPSYGTPQSLGCVELPPSTAQQVWPYTPRGTVVTVLP